MFRYSTALSDSAAKDAFVAAASAALAAQRLFLSLTAQFVCAANAGVRLTLTWPSHLPQSRCVQPMP